MKYDIIVFYLWLIFVWYKSEIFIYKNNGKNRIMLIITYWAVGETFVVKFYIIIIGILIALIFNKELFRSLFKFLYQTRSSCCT